MLGSAITLDLRSQPGDAIVSCRACSQRLVVPAKAYDANAERVLTFIDAHRHRGDAGDVDIAHPLDIDSPQHAARNAAARSQSTPHL
jgi:hypothetical protein